MSPGVGLADDAADCQAESLGVVAAGAGETEKRKLLGSEEPVDECVVFDAAGLLGGESIELDATHNAAGFVLGENEADVLVRNQAVGGLMAGADLKEIGDADFDRNPADGADERPEDADEIQLGRRQEMFAPS